MQFTGLKRVFCFWKKIANGCRKLKTLNYFCALEKNQSPEAFGFQEKSSG
tara:strand:+ start:769 stop:918 length:150 start_codon:yes stop_codon:yes gene_type:complete